MRFLRKFFFNFSKTKDSFLEIISGIINYIYGIINHIIKTSGIINYKLKICFCLIGVIFIHNDFEKKIKNF